MGRPKKKDALVKKETSATLSNFLNEMAFKKVLSLQELRFFLVYVSKLNPDKPDKTEVTFTLDEYKQVLGVELNEAHIQETVDQLVGRVVLVRPPITDEDVVNARLTTTLFSKCLMVQRKPDYKWTLTFNASDDVIPHLFGLTKRFTTFEIWNIINLSNFQDARMYMLLKQYRKIGERTTPIKDLKEMLGIAPDAYPEYKIFARDVLKKCQKNLKERTDICFTFRALGRPAKEIWFEIFPNEDYQLPQFLQPPKAENEVEEQLPPPEAPEPGTPEYEYLLDEAEEWQEQEANARFIRRAARDEICDGLSDSIFDEFSDEQLQHLVHLAWGKENPLTVERFAQDVPRLQAQQFAIAEYIKSKILLCNSKGGEVQSRYGYIRAAVECDYH